MSSNKIRTLVRSDRCDKCNAAARVALAFNNGELMFCGHCFSDMSEPLKEANPNIVGVDESLLDAVR
jgi:hypothetical protein